MPGDLNAVTFTSGGAEANETAINIAKNFTKKQKVSVIQLNLNFPQSFSS